MEEDERDTGNRMLLNFGHTLGHAYELAGHYETWTHGQAVAAGMVRAAGLGERLGVNPRRDGGDDCRHCRPPGTACGNPLQPGGLCRRHRPGPRRGRGSEIAVILLEELGRAVPPQTCPRKRCWRN